MLRFPTLRNVPKVLVLIPEHAAAPIAMAASGAVSERQLPDDTSSC